MEDEAEADHDALAHAARELVGKFVEPRAVDAQVDQDRAGPLHRLPLGERALVGAHRLDEVPLDRHERIEEVSGLWKIIAMSRPRRSRSSRSPIARISLPLNRIAPEVTRPGALSSFSMDRPSVDLPQPDSPTMPSTSPLRTSRESLSTARTVPMEMG